MALPVLLILIILQAVVGENYRRDGFIDHLNNGMKFASDILGTESVASKVAEFVVKAFQTANKPPTSTRRQPPLLNEAYENEDSEEIIVDDNRPNYNVNEASNPMTPLKYLVRLFGLQPNQISAVAVNALVFVAQMISSFLSGNKRPSRPFRSDDPTTWILNKRSKKLQEIISKAKNESLLNDIEDLINNQGDEEETSCIKLLGCKITPFVHKMQVAVFGNEADDNNEKKLRGAAAIYRHLPTTDEINERSDICERKHKDCDLNG